MNILYIVDFYKPNKWWIEVLLSEIVNYFSIEHKISIITWNFTWNLPEIEKIWNITIYRVNAKNLITYAFSAYKKAKEIISDIDIVHWNTFYSALVVKKLAKKYKSKKYFIHVHWFFWQFRLNLIEDKNIIIKNIKALKFKILEKLVSSWWENIRYLAISRYVRDVLETYYWVKNVSLVYNWINYKNWLSNLDEQKIKQNKKLLNKENNFHLLFYWRAEKLKWWDFLLDNMWKYNYKNLTLTMIIYWNNTRLFQKLVENKLLNEEEKGKFFTYLEDKREIKIIWKKVFLLEETKTWNFVINIVPGKEYNQLINYISTADTIVIPSLMEPFGLVWLESCYSNIPVIVNNNWALPEVVFWKVNYFDYPNQESLKNAIENSINWKFDIIPKKDFSLEKMLKKLEELYFN